MRAIFGDTIGLADDPYVAAAGADAVVLITEWHQLRQPDYVRLRQVVRTPVLFEGCNVWDPVEAARRLRVCRHRPAIAGLATIPVRYRALPSKARTSRGTSRGFDHKNRHAVLQIRAADCVCRGGGICMLRSHRPGGSNLEAKSDDTRVGTPGKRTLTEALPGAGGGTAPPGGAASGGGKPLPDAVRSKMEGAFQSDFSDVRIHEGGAAAAMGAVAFTQGNDIHFQPGRYDPASPAGQELLGHELTHVVQQRAGRVAMPQGKDSAINADPGLEAEADVMGARAARGEPAGLRGASASVVGAAPIQRYQDRTLDGKPWRLSDGNKILTQGAATHEMYADRNLVAAASDKLASVKSFIRLEPVPATAGGELRAVVDELRLAQVVPRYAAPDRPPEPHKGPAGLAAMNTPMESRGILRTFSDCNECARMVMGAVYAGAHGGGGPDVEQPISHVGAAKKVEQRDAEYAAFGGAPTVTEQGGLTVLNRSLIAYRDSVHLTELATRSVPLGQAVTRFKQLAVALKPGSAPLAWPLLHQVQTELPAIYEDFTQYAHMNAHAEPEIGDALVTFRVEGAAGAKVSKSQRLYDNMASGASLRVQDTPAYPYLVALFGEERLANMKVGEFDLEKLLAGAKDPEDMTAQLLGPMLAAALKSYAAGVGADLLRKYDITADTPYAKIEQLAKENFDDEPLLKDSFEDNNLWNKHWAGVVMTDGADYASLENDASTGAAESVKAHGEDGAMQKTGGKINEQWRFQLYGSAHVGQSFHAQQMAGGDFGNFAATIGYRHMPAAEQAAVDVSAFPDHVIAIVRAAFARTSSASPPKMRLAPTLALLQEDLKPVDLQLLGTSPEAQKRAIFAIVGGDGPAKPAIPPSSSKLPGSALSSSKLPDSASEPSKHGGTREIPFKPPPEPDDNDIADIQYNAALLYERGMRHYPPDKAKALLLKSDIETLIRYVGLNRQYLEAHKLEEYEEYIQAARAKLRVLGVEC